VPDPEDSAADAWVERRLSSAGLGSRPLRAPSPIAGAGGSLALSVAAQKYVPKRTVNAPVAWAGAATTDSNPDDAGTAEWPRKKNDSVRPKGRPLSPGIFDRLKEQVSKSRLLLDSAKE